MQKTSIYYFLTGIFFVNVFFALQNHFLPVLKNSIPILQYLALSSWGLKHLLYYQIFTYPLIHYTTILDLNYLFFLLIYLYILKKCADHFRDHNKENFFIPLFFLPTAITTLMYFFYTKVSIAPIFSPYLPLTSIVLSTVILSPGRKILQPTHHRPLHKGIPLVWASLAFNIYHMTMGSLNTSPHLELSLINVLVTYLLATPMLKFSSRLFFLSKLERLLHKNISVNRKNKTARIDRILDKIATHGMTSLSLLDKIYLKLSKSHIS